MMSNDLCEYDGGRGDNLFITACVGENWDKSVQFTIGSEYASLDSSQVRHLIIMLKNRLRGLKTHSATSEDLNKHKGKKGVR